MPRSPKPQIPMLNLIPPSPVPLIPKRQTTVASVRPQLENVLVGPPHYESILDALLLHEAGFHTGQEPIGSFLLAGPTGSGKTYTAKALAWALHWDFSRVLLLNCGEFQYGHEVAKLIGAPPGYVGYEAQGSLITQSIFKQKASDYSPVTIVVFDEIEKADKAVVDYLLGALDEGITRTSSREIVSWTNTLVFFTSNLGQRPRTSSYSILPPDKTTFWSPEYAHQSIRKFFSPEFLNRLTAIEYFDAFTYSETRQIVEKELLRFQARLNLELNISDAELDRLTKLAYSPEYGAREVKRTIQREVIKPLALEKLKS